MTVILPELNFYSGVNYMKRDISSGTSTMTLGALNAVTATTITHNLGYIPFFQVFCDQDNTGKIWSANKINRLTRSSSGSSPADPYLTSWATTTTLVINLHNATSPLATGNRTIYYLIYKDYGEN